MGILMTRAEKKRLRALVATQLPLLATATRAQMIALGVPLQVVELIEKTRNKTPKSKRKARQ